MSSNRRFGADWDWRAFESLCAADAAFSFYSVLAVIEGGASAPVAFPSSDAIRSGVLAPFTG
jgi:hypothetical protein